MNSIGKIASRTGTDVKQAVVAAGKVEVGYVANQTLVRLLKKHIKPSGVMGHMVASQLDTALGQAVVGIVAAQAIKELKGSEPKVAMLADAMTFSASQELIRSFDFDGLIEELLSSVGGAAAVEPQA